MVELHLIKQAASFDLAVQQWITAIHTPWLTAIFRSVTMLGNTASIISLAVLVTIYTILRRRGREAVIMGIGLTSAYLLMAWLKMDISRIRPLGEHLVTVRGYSMPSGHAMLSIVAYGFSTYLVHKHRSDVPAWRLAIPAGVVIFLIGFSRIYLNVHFTSDVAAGFAIGGILLLGMIKIEKWKAGSDFPPVL